MRQARSTGARVGSALACVLAAALLAPAASPAKPGDILAADDSYLGTSPDGAWVRVDPANGTHSVIAGATGVDDNPEAIAIDSRGRLILVDRDAPGGPGYNGTIFRLDPRTGAKTVLASGPPLQSPDGIVVDPNGDYLFVDDDSQGLMGNPPGQVFRLRSKGGPPIPVTTDPVLYDPNDLVVLPNGTIYVSDDGGSGNYGGVYRIGPGGVPVRLFSGNAAGDPHGLALTPDGDLIVALIGDSSSLIRLEARTGAVTPIPLLGAALQDPEDVAIAPDGTIYVADPGQLPFAGTIMRVDPKTKATSVLAGGSPLGYISGIAVEPPTCMGRTATIVGSTGRDRLVGSRYADVIAGLSGNDRIKGGKGKDLICAGAGADRVAGGGGKDRCSGGGGSDSGSCERGRL